ncbi:hypothetical protein [Vibrio sp. 10N.222.55.B11]|uniref:hypothetical protein n=1 Tax=Vibrio sp. 10N.222.55.B11 TaxID=3229648 RepID=UPI002A70EF72|nr:conserved hypothetical protein [Vibrio crassostreae]CAK2511197.1 conserved hypothetical protein [Vibrio crassostreae]CAK2515184.1 conserved hypothetical protein [Vibrio crassostreae]CAK2898179.1 conserved hypothetical protein [Vibrio crassostreae]CAK2914845.1 conserved hypothetical protein [Vibrio crassostreae]
MNTEQVTVLVRKAINILFVSNPRGTSLGVLSGIVLDGLIGLFNPFLKSVSIINIGLIKFWHLIGLGVFLFNILPFLNRHKVEPSINEAISYIEKQKQLGSIDEWQAKQMYRNLHSKVLDNVLLNKEQQELSEKIHSIASTSESQK